MLNDLLYIWGEKKKLTKLLDTLVVAKDSGWGWRMEEMEGLKG